MARTGPHKRFWLIWTAIALLLLAAHVVADRFSGPEPDRWLYYTRAGIYALGFLALAVLSARIDRRMLPQLFILLALLGLTDLVFYFVRGRPAIEHPRYVLPDYPQDHPGYHLGELPPADAVQPDLKMKDGDTLYYARYTIDDHFRRTTPGHDSSRTHHALFFGCSVCFGQWMSDDQTMPAYYQQMSSAINSYNYAYPGWSTEQMLARFEYEDLSQQVPEQQGVCVYTFIWSHIYRSIGDMHTYCSWGFQHPYYELVAGEARRNKRFKDGRPIRSTLYELLWRSNIVRYFDLNLPLSLDEKDLELNVAIVRGAKRHYLEQFPHGRFVVFWAYDWPWPGDETMQERYLKLLKESDIDFVDGRRPDRMDTTHVLVGDGHPTALAHREMAQWLAAGLDSLGFGVGPSPSE